MFKLFKTLNLEISHCQRIALKCLGHVGPDYFSSFNQSDNNVFWHCHCHHPSLSVLFYPLDSCRWKGLPKTVNLSIGYWKMSFSILIAPAAFWPRGQNPRKHYRNPSIIENMYGINTRKNLESQEQGPPRICG